MVLYLGYCCRAFDRPWHQPRTDDKDAKRFLRYFRALVVQYHQDPDADPKALKTDCPRYRTLDWEALGVRKKVNSSV